MRILMVAAGPPSVASARARLYQYMPALAANGIDARVVPFYSDAALDILGRPASPHMAARMFSAARTAWLGALSGAYDLLIWQRVLLPVQLLRLVRARSRRMIFDVDDALYASPPDAPNDPATHARRTERFDRTASTSDAVIASTAAIAERAARVQPHTYQLLSPVDTDLFRPPVHRTQDPLVIGWIGSPSTSCYLEPLLPALARMARRPGVRIMLVGSELPELPVGIEQVPWQLERESADLAEMNIGIMPLDSDEWSRAKGGYKALLYQASGVACVASAVGAACEIIEHDDNGLLTHEIDDWVPALERLVEDSSLRSRIATRAQQTVDERHSLRVSAPRFVDILHRVAESPGCARTV